MFVAKKPQLFGKDAATFRQRCRNFLAKMPQLFGKDAATF